MHLIVESAKAVEFVWERGTVGKFLLEVSEIIALMINKETFKDNFQEGDVGISELGVPYEVLNPLIVTELNNAIVCEELIQTMEAELQVVRS